MFLQFTNYVVFKKLIKRKKNSEKPSRVSKSSYLLTSPARERSTNRKQEKCSICSKPAEVQLGENIDDTSISKAIGNTTNIWINESVGQSKYICKNCLSDLKTALKFKKKCETSSSLHQFSGLSGDKDFSSNTPPQTVVKIEKVPQNENVDPDLITSPTLPISKKRLNRKNAHLRDLPEESCPECGEKVKDVKNHIKAIHRRTVKNTCTVCGKIVIGLSAFSTHMSEHRHTRYYACTACPYKTKIKNHLVIHLRTHTGYKPYLCSECPRQFSHAGNFSKHMQRHAGLTYQCDKCPKKFYLKQGLKFHYESAHLEVMVKHKCSFCEKEFKTRKGLLRHELKIHKREKMKRHH